MKFLLLISLTFVTYAALAQKAMFVRVFDLKGKKITSGKIAELTDSSFKIRKNSSRSTMIPFRQIGIIETKRSAGHNVLIGALIGSVAFGIVGATGTESDTQTGYDLDLFSSPGEQAAVGAVVGLTIGAAIGGITALFKKSKTIVIKGDPLKWKGFQSYINQLTKDQRVKIGN